MGRVAALGERARVAGLALVGAVVVVAEEPDAVRLGWRELPDDVDLVILTSAAADVLGPEAGSRQDRRPLIAVMPP
jgi:vacuolar-type H+-ATPase subunit F/Vma7